MNNSLEELPSPPAGEHGKTSGATSVIYDRPRTDHVLSTDYLHISPIRHLVRLQRSSPPMAEATPVDLLRMLASSSSLCPVRRMDPSRVRDRAVMDQAPRRQPLTWPAVFCEVCEHEDPGSYSKGRGPSPCGCMTATASILTYVSVHPRKRDPIWSCKHSFLSQLSTFAQ